jgi:hypothetical protein
MGGILGSTGANAASAANPGGTGGAASGLLGSLAGGGKALSSLTPWGAAAGAVGSVVGNWKKKKAADKEFAREQGIVDQNYNANLGFQQSLTDPNSEAGKLFAGMVGPQTTTQSGTSASQGGSTSDTVSGMEFGAHQGDAEAALQTAKDRVAKAGLLASNEIKAGAQALSDKTSRARTAISNMMARQGLSGGASAADLAAITRNDTAAQSQLVSDAMKEKYGLEQQAEQTIPQLLMSLFGKQHTKQKGTQWSTGSSSGTMTGPGNYAAGLQALSPIQKEILKKG